MQTTRELRDWAVSSRVTSPLTSRPAEIRHSRCRSEGALPAPKQDHSSSPPDSSDLRRPDPGPAPNTRADRVRVHRFGWAGASPGACRAGPRRVRGDGAVRTRTGPRIEPNGCSATHGAGRGHSGVCAADRRGAMTGQRRRGEAAAPDHDQTTHQPAAAEASEVNRATTQLARHPTTHPQPTNRRRPRLSLSTHGRVPARRPTAEAQAIGPHPRLTLSARGQGSRSRPVAEAQAVGPRARPRGGAEAASATRQAVCGDERRSEGRGPRV